MERIQHLNTLGLKYDHIALTQSYDSEGKVVSISKAKFIEAVYKKPGNTIIFIDDRLKSVLEFVELNLGIGFSMDRPYNDQDLKKLQENPILENKIYLGRGKTMKDQVEDVISQIEIITDILGTKVFAMQKGNL